MKTPQTIASFHQIPLRRGKSIRRRFRDFATWCAIVAMLHFQLAVPTRLFANPVDGSVVAGSATINQQGNVLDVMQQSDRAVINWGQFSIGAGEIANFHLPSASSAVLNRVMTPGMPSEIFGALNSNGQVFLINPSGVMIGPSGVINAGGFTASALDIPNADFMRGGNLHFQGNGTGSIINQGSIITGAGGVALIGGSVVNQGTIVSDGGTVSLVVGDNVTLSAAGTYVQAEMSVLLNGLSEYAGVINNAGVIRATGAANIGGEVYLVNPGGTVLQAGLIAAQKQAADGALAGGAVKIDAAEAQIGGTIEASGSTGGRVEITGNGIALAAATIDASGDHGGGAVRIGGGVQGKDPALRNAQSTTVDATSLISADSRLSGNAGSVVVYAAGQTDFAGQISARAFGSSGDGGFVEVSGRNTLILNGTVDTSSLAGFTGTLLLDPTNFDVRPPGSGDDFVNFISADTLVGLLNSNNVVIQTAVLTPVDDPGTGTIWVQPGAEVIWSNDNSLTFLAHGDIFINDNVQNDGTGAVNLVAGWDGVTGSPDPGTPGVIPDGPPDPIFDLAAILADPASYGNTTYADGHVLIQSVGGTNRDGVAVGSAFGETNVLANQLTIRGRDDDLGYAQLGFTHQSGGAGTVTTGPINVYLKGELNVSAGAIGSSGGGDTSSFAQLGHGGWRFEGGGVSNYRGDITLSVGGNVVLYGSSNRDTYAQIGHGGHNADGNHRGLISLTVGGAVGLLSGTGSGAYTQIGHGGSQSAGNQSGGIEITATGIPDYDASGGLAVGLLAGEGNNAYALIGHGGHNSVGDKSGRITLDLGNQLRLYGGEGRQAFAQVGHGGFNNDGNFNADGNRSGNILISADASIGLFGGGNTGAYAQIGHGGNNVDDDGSFGGTIFDGDHSGNITLTSGGAVGLLGGFGDGAYTQIGHGGMENYGSQSGAISITAAGVPDFDADGGLAVGLLAGVGNNAYALIGHGGTGNDYSAVNSTGDISLDLSDQLRLYGGEGNVAYAQIGHGGAYSYGDNTIGSTGFSTLGNILLDLNDELLLAGGGGEVAYAQIGHGGYYSGADMTIVNGDITLTGATAVTLSTGSNGDTYSQIGHGGGYAWGRLYGLIDLQLSGALRLNADTGGAAYAQIGHGGRNAGDFAAPAFEFDGDVYVTGATTVTLNGGGTDEAYAQIGHGGIWSDGNLGGVIEITASGMTTLAGGSGRNAYALIGHGGTYSFGEEITGNITLQLSDALQLNAGAGESAFAQIGHGGQETNQSNVSGDIYVAAVKTVALNGGSFDASYAQIGHGGYLARGDLSGMMTLNLSDELQLNGGEGWKTYAQIGHGGMWGNGNLSGAIDITANGMTTLAAGSGNNDAYALIGHGGSNYGTDAPGTVTGSITLDLSDELRLSAGGVYAFAQIGHGGLESNGIFSGDVDITVGGMTTIAAGNGDTAYALVGHGGAFFEGEEITGNVTLRLSDVLQLNAGDNQFTFAQIGHGGYSSGRETTNVNGDILITGATTAALNGVGGYQGYAQIGHGGGEVNGSLSGQIGVQVSDAVQLNGGNGNAAYAQIGHGGWYVGDESSTALAYSGDITLTGTGATALTLSGGSNSQAYAQIGHGGANSYGNLGGAINFTKVGKMTLTGGGDAAAYAQIGHGGDNSSGDSVTGSITSDLSDALQLNGGPGNGAYAQFGHGGRFSSGGADGNIAITAVGLVNLVGGNVNQDAYALIGHGGLASNQSGKNVTGDITLSLGDGLQLNGGTALNAFAQIGHGGLFSGGDTTNLGGEIQITAAKAVTLSGGANDSAFAQIGHGGAGSNGNQSDDITLHLSDALLLHGGNGLLAYAQIGHGGVKAGYYSSTPITFSGAIAVTGATLVTLQGGDSIGAYAQIGHGGDNSFANLAGKITLDLSDALQLLGGTNADTYAQIGHGGDQFGMGATPFTISGDIQLATEKLVTLQGGSGGIAYAQIGHYGGTGYSSQSGDVTLDLGDALVLSAGAGSFAFAQIGHGGLAPTGSVEDGAISIVTAGDVILSTVGADPSAYAQIGHYTGGGAAGGPMDVTVGGNLTMTGNMTGQWAWIGHYGSDAGGSVSGDIRLIVNDSALITQGIIGHSASNYPTGNTWIGVGQGPSNTGTITADITSLFNSAPAGELRFYMPDRNSYQIAAGTLLNGVAGAAPGTVPLPNEQGFYTFGNGPYVPTVGNYALYFTPVAPNPVVIVGISPGQFATDQFTRYQNYWESIATLPTGGVRYLGGITYGAHRHWFTGLTDLDSFNLFGPPTSEPPADGAGNNQ